MDPKYTGKMSTEPKMNNFKKLMVQSGPNKGKGTTRLHEICESMYNYSLQWQDDFIVQKK